MIPLSGQAGLLRRAARLTSPSEDKRVGEASMASTQAAEVARPTGMVRWIVVFWVFVIAAVSYLDRNNISIAISSIQKEFGLSNVQLGTVFSAFVFGYAFTQPFAGRLADRFGPYKLIAFAILW